MPCDIILLILSFICYNFFGMERVNPVHPKNATILGEGGWKGLTLSIPKMLQFFGPERVPKIVAYEEQNLKYDAKWHHGTGKG
jgi:hypothetical protein